MSALAAGLWTGLSGSVDTGWLSVACEVKVAGATVGLEAAMLAGLLDLLLSFCVFFVAQLAEEGKAEPSPLSLRLIASSWVADLLDPLCGAAEMLCGAC